MLESAIHIRNLFKIFGPKPHSMLRHVRNGISKLEILDKHKHVVALNNVNIEMPANRIQVIMGLSGSGKSTFIRHVNRLIEPTIGDIHVAGQNVLEMNPRSLRNFRRFRVSMVFQHFALLPHRTIIDNIAYGLTIQNSAANSTAGRMTRWLDRVGSTRMSESEIEKRSRKWLDRVGLTGFDGYYPGQMSGGMQQRVGLARALATDAEILLMDEPFSALDPLIRTDMQEVLLGLQEELHKTIIFITHDLNEGLRIGDNIAILRDGVIVQNGTPQDIILHPADQYVSDFTKDINRGRVLQVSSIMEVHTPRNGPRVDQNMVIEDALVVLSAAHASSATVTCEDKPVGSISLEKMISVLANSDGNGVLNRHNTH